MVFPALFSIKRFGFKRKVCEKKGDYRLISNWSRLILLLFVADRSKISRDRNWIQFNVNLYPLSFFANTPFKCAYFQTITINTAITSIFLGRISKNKSKINHFWVLICLKKNVIFLQFKTLKLINAYSNTIKCFGLVFYDY